MPPEVLDNEYDVFVSYSRHDGALVDAVGGMLQLGDRRVFWDKNGIAAGSEWEPALEDALKRSAMVVVLWCCKSAESDWVAREIRLARRHGIPVVAIRLCAYPVPRNIRKRQWVDMQGIVVHACSHTVVDGPKEFTGGAKALLEDRVKARRHRVERSALLQGAFGAALVVLALWRPFPSSLTPGQANHITGVVAALGAALVTLSFLRLAVENSPRALPIGRTQETLEMIVDGLLKR
jgi:TIR domain